MNGRTGPFVLVGLLWAGLVLVACQRGEPPVGLSSFALMAAWCAVFGLSAWGAGALVYGAVLRRLSRGFDEALLALVLGTGLLAAIAAVLGSVGALRPPALLAALGGLAAIGVLELRRRPFPGLSVLKLRSPWILPLVIAASAWAISLLSVTADSAFYDQLHYHLAFPAQWLRAGRLLTFPSHDYSFYPAGMGLLYVYALAALGPWAAQAIHWMLGVLAMVAAARLALRVAGPGAAYWTAAILSATPVLMWLSTIAGGDLGPAAYGAVGLLALALGLGLGFEAADRDRGAWWLMAGAAAGLAAGAKLLALLTVCVPLFVVLAWAQGTARQRVRRLFAWSIGAACPLVPWLWRNVELTGNPVYPFLPSLFTRGSGAATGVGHLGSQGALQFMSDPLRVLTLGALGPLDGSVGPLYLLLAPLAVWCGLRSRGLGRTLLCASALGVLGWSAGPPTARYLTPVLFPLAALAGTGVAHVLELSRGRARVAATAVAIVCAWSMLQGVDRESLVRAGTALGRDSRDAALLRWASYWPAVSVVNELPLESRVLLVAESRTLYFDRDVLFEDPFRRPLLCELAERTASADALAAELRQRGVTHVLFNGIEGRRIAALNGRAEYFDGLSSAARARLDEFLGHRLKRVWSQGELELFALS
jgi:hypothetical protein